MEITGNTFFLEWEVDLMVWIQTHLGTIGPILGTLLTQFGEPPILFLIVGIFYFGIDKKYGKYMAANCFSVCLIGSMIKNIALRRRPYFDHESIQCLRPAEAGDINDLSLQGFSFPSLHSATTINLYTITGRYMKENRLLRIICLVLPFLVGLSRIIIGVHYPTDVLFGWILGLILMLLIDLLLKLTNNLSWVFGIMIAAATPGFFFCKSADFYTSYGIMIGTLSAFLFENKYVNFKPAKNFWFIIIRTLIGGAIFAGLSGLLKLPFPKELLESHSMLSFSIRTARYAIASFIMMGVYPLCFRKGALDL